MPKITEGQFALGGIALIAVWLLVVLPLLYRPAQQTPQVYAQQQADSALKGEEHAKAATPSAAKANEEHGGKHPEQGENEGTEFWPPFLGVRLKITDSLLAIFTGGLLIFTGLLWRSTDKLWAAGEKQIAVTREAFIADQRAWIAVDLTVKGDLVYRKHGAYVEVSVLVTNIGRTAALRSHVAAMVLSDPMKLHQEVERFCGLHCKRNIKSSRLVMPNESYSEAPAVLLEQAQIEGASEAGEIEPTIIGCVTYEILQDDLIHQTAFVYVLTHRMEVEGMMESRIPFFIDHGNVKAADIAVDVGTGGFAT